MKHGTPKLACLALAVVALVTLPLVAKADNLTLTLTSGASVVTLTSTGAPLSYNGGVGNWQINVTTGIGNTTLGPGVMDLNSIDLSTSGTANPLTIDFTDSGLTKPIGIDDYLMTIGGTSTSTVSYQTYYDSTLLNTLAFTTTPFSGSVGGTNNFVSPYSISQVATIGAGGPGTISSFDARFQIPEPASLSLVGLGLLVAAGGLRKRLMNR
jgi:hypothetical protein